MAGNGAIFWLFLSILQAFLVFSGIFPPEMEILSALLGGNSVGFFFLFLYFMLKRKPKSHMDSDYNQSERTFLQRGEDGKQVEVNMKSAGSNWERWATIIWFVMLIIGTLSFIG